MKRVDIEELRDHPLRLLAGEEPLAIELDGQLLGVYHPVKGKNTEEAKRALEEFEEAVERILAESGMTREEFADALDLTRPFKL